LKLVRLFGQEWCHSVDLRAHIVCLQLPMFLLLNSL
jgi:hypothetical protein